jgi:lysyl-tRNA synthetase class 2
MRGAAFRAIRAFFDKRGYLEVDTPLLVTHPGLEPHLDPLQVGQDRWLITSPELSMKKIVAGGMGRIFQLSHVFRAGEKTKRHAEEFMLLEWYRIDATLDDLAKETLQLVRHVARALGLAKPPPFQKKTIAQLFAQHGVDVTASDLPRAVRSAGMHLRAGADWEDAFFHVMVEKIEPQLGSVVVKRWPMQVAALARRCDDDARFCERFEIYGNGLELCNAFDELTDPVEQRARFVADNEKRAQLGKQTLPIDEQFLAALPRMPRTCGNALGVDRLLMFLTNATEISAVNFRR